MAEPQPDANETQITKKEVPKWHKNLFRMLGERDGRGPSVAWSANVYRNGQWNITKTQAMRYINALPKAIEQEQRKIDRGMMPKRFFTLEYVKELEKEHTDEKRWGRNPPFTGYRPIKTAFKKKCFQYQNQ